MNEETLLIQKQNDEFRKNIMIPVFGIPEIQGQHVISFGIQEFGAEAQIILTALVRNYDDFSEENDPHGEHDFGVITYEGNKIFWKIDYYDMNYNMGSENPSDPTQTRRVLTIFLADEY